MKNKTKRRSLSRFASHILLSGAIVITVFCVGYITTLDMMSSTYRAAIEFYVLLLAELTAFTCFADYIHKTL
ncbi:MAG: hypothetical protein A2Y15_00750 [Clostridiales bacterium GWF2_36_10]|nr:MAG: hypothetical protein A2Y15_00750 [Clostridiales bacterium GWF2_36_10]HAN21503.1 hypothetical protein [Clostridiales bacterium]